MAKSITSIIGGITIIFSVFLPVLSIFTTYKDYNIVFHYWAIGLMYVYLRNGDNGTDTGIEFQANIIGIGVDILFVVFGILIILKSIEGRGSNLMITFGIISMITIVSFTALIYFALWNALYNIGLGNIASSLIPSYGFYVALIGGILMIIGGSILKKSSTKIQERQIKVLESPKSQKIETFICQKCGKINRTEDKFCIECGASLKR
ncbi:MAG: zinc ribbon domain-containing protein [Promethearchaeota archaeon]